MRRFIKDTILLLRLKLNNLKSPKNTYHGRLIDAMAQTDSKISAEDIEYKMSTSKVEHMVLFSRQQEPYDSTKHVPEIAKKLGSKITLGSPKRFDQFETLDDDFVKQLVECTVNGPCKFIGELQMSHADKWSSPINLCEVTLRGERYIDAMSPGMLKLMDQLDGKNIPVFLHWEAYEWDRDWPRFNELFKRYPNIKFIWPHCGYAKAKYVNEVLHRHKNVYATLSKRDNFHFKGKWRTFTGEDVGCYCLSNVEWQDRLGSSILDTNGEINSEWFQMLKRFPDRFMFATDCHMLARWGYYIRIVELWRIILGSLPTYLAENIAYKNAEKIFGIKN